MNEGVLLQTRDVGLSRAELHTFFPHPLHQHPFSLWCQNTELVLLYVIIIIYTILFRGFSPGPLFFSQSLKAYRVRSSFTLYFTLLLTIIFLLQTFELFFEIDRELF